MEEDQQRLRRQITDTETISLRQFLLLVAAAEGASIHVAIEAVSTTALAHPEWNLDERQTLKNWCRRFEYTL